jgi:hypothetical protein
MSGEYENLRRVVYGDSDSEHGQAQFVPVCPECGRFVKADKSMTFKGFHLEPAPNARCRRHGRVVMPFEGFF